MSTVLSYITWKMIPILGTIRLRLFFYFWHRNKIAKKNECRFDWRFSLVSAVIKCHCHGNEAVLPPVKIRKLIEIEKTIIPESNQTLPIWISTQQSQITHVFSSAYYLIVKSTCTDLFMQLIVIQTKNQDWLLKFRNRNRRASKKFFDFVQELQIINSETRSLLYRLLKHSQSYLLTFPYGLDFKKENLFRMQQVAGIKIEVKLKICVIKITQPQMLTSIIQLSRLEKKLAGRKRSRNVTWKGLLR